MDQSSFNTEQLQQAVKRVNLREQELIIERQKSQKLAQLLQERGINLNEIDNLTTSTN